MPWINHPQGSNEWFEARKGVLTASKFSDCITSKLHKISESGINNISESLAKEKLGIPLKPTYVSEHMEYGNRYESEARYKFQEHSNYKVNEVGFYKRNFNGFDIGCSPDGVIEQQRRISSDRYRGIEIKCPGMKRHLESFEIINNSGQIPQLYYAQIQFSMFVTGYNYWYFASYRHDHRIATSIDAFDKSFEDKIIEVIKLVKDKTETKIKELINESNTSEH